MELISSSASGFIMVFVVAGIGLGLTQTYYSLVNGRAGRVTVINSKNNA